MGGGEEGGRGCEVGVEHNAEEDVKSEAECDYQERGRSSRAPHTPTARHGAATETQPPP